MISGGIPFHSLSAKLRSDMTSIVGMITLAMMHTSRPRGVLIRNMEKDLA